MMRGRLLIVMAVLVAALQIGFLAWTISGRAAVLRNGTEVSLSIAPVDPRDLLRGDYVRLAYDISRIPGSFFAGQVSADEGYRQRTVFVRLRKGPDGIWEAVSASLDTPSATPPAAGEVDIRGIATSRWSDTEYDVTVRYGLERYYVPEGEGRALETNPELRSFVMLVAVAADGTAQIKALYDGDTLIYEEPIY